MLGDRSRSPCKHHVRSTFAFPVAAKPVRPVPCSNFLLGSPFSPAGTSRGCPRGWRREGGRVAYAARRVYLSLYVCQSVVHTFRFPSLVERAHIPRESISACTSALPLPSFPSSPFSYSGLSCLLPLASRLAPRDSRLAPRTSARAPLLDNLSTRSLTCYYSLSPSLQPLAP